MITLRFILALIVTGLIVGALGRLAIPGRNPMGIPATIGIGILGALIGGLIAGALHVGGLLSLLIAVAVAALLVYLISSRSRSRI